MYETNKEYLAIVQRELRSLEESCNCKISDGDIGFCPRCGRHGIWDIASKGFIHHEGNSIYYSTVFYDWRCGTCDSRSLSLQPAFLAIPLPQREEEKGERQ